MRRTASSARVSRLSVPCDYAFSNQQFFHVTKKSWQKLKYLQNERSFWDEIKSIFHHFYRAFNKADTIFFGRWESGFKGFELHLFQFRFPPPFIFNLILQNLNRVLFGVKIAPQKTKLAIWLVCSAFWSVLPSGLWTWISLFD